MSEEKKDKQEKNERAARAEETEKKAKKPDSECKTEATTVEKWQKEALRCQEQAQRALADYQNLLRRQKEDQEKMVQVAKSVIFSSLLQPLSHLSLAAQAISDQGLNMVIDQFWQVLHEQGLQEINPLNQEFDPETMEAVERTGEGNCVTQVLSPGYMLGSQVLQVAKVRVG
ncbi:MAG: nucleotide exchange factor GrpE [bacterium]|nr:nucleotide exchange factor GrpE [bacterium]